MEAGNNARVIKEPTTTLCWMEYYGIVKPDDFSVTKTIGL